MTNRYLRILFLYTKVNAVQQLAHRDSFVMAICAKCIRMATVLIFWQALFALIPSLGGWNRISIFYLAATYLTVESLILMSFYRNLLYYLPDILRKGEFDSLLTKPVNVLFHISFRRIDIRDFVSMFVVATLWCILIIRYPFSTTFAGFISFALLVACAYFFMASITIICSSMLFRVIIARGVGRLLEGVMRIARYPTDSFGGVLSLIVGFILPISLIATWPAQALLGRLSPWLVLYGISVTALIFGFSIWIWNRSLRNYSSASS